MNDAGNENDTLRLNFLAARGGRWGMVFEIWEGGAVVQLMNHATGSYSIHIGVNLREAIDRARNDEVMRTTAGR